MEYGGMVKGNTSNFFFLRNHAVVFMLVHAVNE